MYLMHILHLNKCESPCLQAILVVSKHWSPRWAHSEAVHLLADDFDAMATINRRNQEERAEIAELI